MLRIRPLLLILFVAGTLRAAMAAPVNPAPQDARDARRVPGRAESPALVFPAQEVWSRIETHADERVVTRTYQPALPAGTPGIDFATVTTLRGIWHADLSRAQHLFGQRLSAECPGVRASLWLADSSGLGRRLVAWKCEQGDPPFAVLQLLLQGRDDLFSIELYARSGVPGEGLLVRWAEWLKQVTLCDRGPGAPPCPDGNGDQ